MHDLEREDVIVHEPVKRRPANGRLAQLGDRLGRRSLPTVMRGDRLEPGGDRDGELDNWYDQDGPRFPLAGEGYERAAVDEHIAGLERELSALERELADVRARKPVREEVTSELQRIGEQTSSILVAAYERARETTREAQTQADRCLADAADQARAMTDDATRKCRQIEEQTRRLAEERERLLGDIGALAEKLSSVAQQRSSRRVPTGPQPDRPVKQLLGSFADDLEDD